jgi:hypothetical protein
MMISGSHMIRTLQTGLAAMPLLFAASTAVAGELVFNGGFETGNFAGWSVPPNIPNQSHFRVAPFGGAHGGQFWAGLASSNLQFISQVLPTQAGENYELSFWLRWTSLSPVEQLTVRWEGQPVLFVPASFEPMPWSRFSVPVHANITGSFLEFGQSAFPGEFQIDDISVVPVPAPSAAAVLLLGSVVAFRRRRHRSN